MASITSSTSGPMLATTLKTPVCVKVAAVYAAYRPSDMKTYVKPQASGEMLCVVLASFPPPPPSACPPFFHDVYVYISAYSHPAHTYMHTQKFTCLHLSPKLHHLLTHFCFSLFFFIPGFVVFFCICFILISQTV